MLPSPGSGLGLHPLGKQRRKRYHHRHKFHRSKLLRPSSEFCLLLSFLDQMDKVELRGAESDQSPLQSLGEGKVRARSRVLDLLNLAIKQLIRVPLGPTFRRLLLVSRCVCNFWLLKTLKPRWLRFEIQGQPEFRNIKHVTRRGICSNPEILVEYTSQPLPLGIHIGNILSTCGM